MNQLRSYLHGRLFSEDVDPRELSDLDLLRLVQEYDLDDEVADYLPGDDYFATCAMLATAHIPKTTADLLEAGEAPGGIGYHDITDYGWVLYTYLDPDDDIPEGLDQIYRFARMHNCRYVFLDCDAPVHDALKTWEW